MSNPSTGRRLYPGSFKLLSVGLNALLLWTGCASSYKATLPPDLANNIAPTLTFIQIKESPDTYRGQLVILGGQIPTAKRLQHSTELTILQLPLINEKEPTTELTHSQGRFIAHQEEFLDPATVPAGTRVTLVGELSGSLNKSLDEIQYAYPTLIIKHLKVWPTFPSDYHRYGPRYPYWTPYAYYPLGPPGRYYGYYPYYYW